MKKRSQDPLENTRKVALLLLARRRHTRKEIRCKLTGRGFEPRIVENVLMECERLKYIDDETTADFYLEELARKRFGLLRMREAMRSRGFDQHLTNRVIEEHQLSKLEPEIAAAAAEKKMSALQRETDHRKRREKLVGFLRSRGFSSSTICAVLNEIEDI